MAKLHKLFLGCLLLIISQQLSAQHLLVGRTMSTSEGDVVQLASIINTQTGIRKISNRSGYFSISVRETDTLVITAIGYDSVKIIATTLDFSKSIDSIMVWMKPKTARLKEVKVVASNPKRDSLARAAAEFLKTDPLMNNYDRILNRNKGGLMSPLTAIYQQFSKEGQDMAHFEEFLAYMEKQKLVDRRYNRDVVKRVTKIHELQLDEFMLFCKLNKDFVIEASEYDLIKAIQDCERNFLAQQK